MTYADDSMRHDPARRQAVREQIERHQAAFAEAQALVEAAHALLTGLGDISDEPLIERTRKAVWNATYEIERNVPLILYKANDTYIGNQAAFGAPAGWSEPAATAQLV